MFFPNLIMDKAFIQSTESVLSPEGVKTLSLVHELMNEWNVLQNNPTPESSDRILQVHNEFHISVEAFKAQYVEDISAKGIKIPLSHAKSILKHSSSILRARYLVKFYNLLDESDWFKTFFDNWTLVEFGDEVIAAMYDIFRDKDISYIMQSYADPEVLAEWQQLPDMITVYRGCSENSKNGLSWSSDLEVAKFFASRRYDLFHGMSMKIRMFTSVVDPSEKDFYLNLKPETIYILVAQVKKEDALLFLNRKENEIFTTNAKILHEYALDSLTEIKSFSIQPNVA